MKWLRAAFRGKAKRLALRSAFVGWGAWATARADALRTMRRVLLAWQRRDLHAALVTLRKHAAAARDATRAASAASSPWRRARRRRACGA